MQQLKQSQLQIEHKKEKKRKEKKEKEKRLHDSSPDPCRQTVHIRSLSVTDLRKLHWELNESFESSI